MCHRHKIWVEKQSNMKYRPGWDEICNQQIFLPTYNP
jgi:hypothetical protein